MSEAGKALDAGQYSADSIHHYERVYGEDFVSPGGIAMARQLVGSMGLAADARVLDVGCGLGGSAFVMAREFGLRVDGIDLSANMIEGARKKLARYGLNDRVSFSLGDCLELEDENRYDAVYSRDVFLHVHDKARLFGVLKSTLKPGGLLLFTDYCCGEAPWSHEFSQYVKERDYCLHTLDAYAAILTAAGFASVTARDYTPRFIETLEEELDRIPALALSVTVRQALERGWRDKLNRAHSGDQVWGLFSARRS